MSKYYIVDSAILPDVMDKVIEARQMLENGTVRQVSEAVKRVGISRGTYYKYKRLCVSGRTGQGTAQGGHLDDAAS